MEFKYTFVFIHLMSVWNACLFSFSVIIKRIKVPYVLFPVKSSSFFYIIIDTIKQMPQKNKYWPHLDHCSFSIAPRTSFFFNQPPPFWIGLMHGIQLLLSIALLVVLVLNWWWTIGQCHMCSYKLKMILYPMVPP